MIEGTTRSTSATAFHEAHRAEWERDSTDEERQSTHDSWFRTDTADYWRHARMYDAATALSHRPELTWVTIGDGRFGLDAIRIRRMGFRSVLSTDIGGALLEKAKSRGLIEDYAVENAESLTFGDDTFDVVFCKESYHHCPRGPLALYEMLRIARHAVILVEPRDYVIDHGPHRATGPVGLLRGFISWCRDRLGMALPLAPIEQRYLTGDTPHYEQSGNYMYTISSRELEKVALGLNLPAIALKGLNDDYVAGGETEPATESSAVFRAMREAITAADAKSEAGRGSTGMLMAMLFKERPDEQTRKYLADAQWSYRDLPRNPHIAG